MAPPNRRLLPSDLSGLDERDDIASAASHGRRRRTRPLVSDISSAPLDQQRTPYTQASYFEPSEYTHDYDTSRANDDETTTVPLASTNDGSSLRSVPVHRRTVMSQSSHPTTTAYSRSNIDNTGYEPRHSRWRPPPSASEAYTSERSLVGPRRPLPRVPRHSDTATIDIDDDPFQDPYYEDRRGSPNRYRSHGRRDSYRVSRRSTDLSEGSYDSPSPSEMTMVTDEKDQMRKRHYGHGYDDNDYEEEEEEEEEEEDDDVYDDYDGDSNSERFQGPAPTGPQNRRGARAAHMSKKQVPLINGELVVECRIPTTLYQFIARRDSREFTHMRYTAVTCDPDEFNMRGYQLRQQVCTPPRETEILICVTMYNENEIDFTRTIYGVMRNISYLCGRKKSRRWGKNGWKNIAVVIMIDGRKKVHPRTLNALAAMGVYQDGVAKNIVNGKQVTTHIYEHTTQVALDSELNFKGAETGLFPCQLTLCLKEHNSKKINSHRWLFNAFGQALQPNVCVLLDVGTKPSPSAVYHLWKAFDQDSNIAGAAGEIKAGKGKGWRGLLNPLVASQNFEYKMSNILDKPVESVFGYISVLPGALSAYRYIALQNDPETGYGPLSKYFKGETLHGKNADVFTANMYLAEDRILCWELVAKRNEQWVLRFVKSAVGETDVPDSVPEFISQRRRWLNGAFFAAVYSLIQFRQIWRTEHALGRKILLQIEFLYQFVQLLFTFFSLANFYLTFYFVAGSLGDKQNDPFGHKIGQYIFVVLRYACVLVICLQFILSMGNRPQGAKRMFISGMVIYSIIMAYTTFAAIYMVVLQFKNGNDSNLGSGVFINVIVSLFATIGLYITMSFLYLDPWHIFTSSLQYFFLLPSFLCTLQTYAFCNTHDISWGTKGDNVLNNDLGAASKANTSDAVVELEMPSEQLDIDSCYQNALYNLRESVPVPDDPVSEAQQQEDYYRAVRTYMVSVWVVCNAILAMGVSEAYGSSAVGNNIYLAVLLWSVAGLSLFRAIGSTTFLVIRLVQNVAEGGMKFRAASGVADHHHHHHHAAGDGVGVSGPAGRSDAAAGNYPGGKSVQVTESGVSSLPNTAVPPVSSGLLTGKDSDIDMTTKMQDMVTESQWALRRGMDTMKFWK